MFLTPLFDGGLLLKKARRSRKNFGVPFFKNLTVFSKNFENLADPPKTNLVTTYDSGYMILSGNGRVYYYIWEEVTHTSGKADDRILIFKRRQSIQPLFWFCKPARNHFSMLSNIVYFLKIFFHLFQILF